MSQPNCPRCFNGFVRRSRRRGPLDHLLSLLSIYPYRCQLCRHRFSVRQRGVTFQRVDEDRRDYERIPVQLPATFATGAVRGSGTLLDLSMAGCALHTDAQLREGMLLYLELAAPEEADPIRVEAAALRTIDPDRAHVEFLRLEDGQRERLQRLIRACIASATGHRPSAGEAAQT